MQDVSGLNRFIFMETTETAEEAVASERSIGCIQGKAFPDGEALNTSKVVTQTKQSNTRTGQDKVNIKQLPQVKHWPKSSRYKAVATSKSTGSACKCRYRSEYSNTRSAAFIWAIYHYKDGRQRARPKEQTTHETQTTKKEAGTEAMPMPDVSPILREELRQNKQVHNTNSADKPSHGKTRREIKLANYDGTSEWSDFKSHFDACAVINNWDDQQKRVANTCGQRPVKMRFRH
ncbi:unnamed protein product [Mytilus coruscus]|uniref:Uncharacterized protein n=1 Tax=Mytilus coruscus TaxID=42192 RepID=A0A6J8AZU8_MYTCO|nr:unnamed protein product [Mytilus coruscus]